MLVIREAARFLLRNRGRAVLAGLGIVATLAVLTLLTGMAAGTQASALRRFEAMGLDRMWIVSDTDPAHRLTTLDAQAIRQVVGARASVACSRRFGTDGIVRAGGDESAATAHEVQGPYAFAAGSTVLTGRPLLESDQRTGALVCTVSREVADKLNLRVADTVSAFGLDWRVVGVFAGDGRASVLVPDGSLTPPPPAGPLPVDRIDIRLLEGSPSTWAPALLRLVRTTGPSGDQRRCTIVVPEELARAARAAIHEIGMLELAIGAGGLVLGSLCLGIAMIGSVRERRDEFGLRLMLGSTPRALLLQVAIETVAIACASSVVGVIVGAACGEIIAMLFPIDVFFSPRVFLIWILVTTPFGLVAALAPAREATRIHPARLLGVSA